LTLEMPQLHNEASSAGALLELRLGGVGADYGSADALYLSTGGGRWPRPPWVAAATTDALPGRRNHGCGRNARKQACAGVQDEGNSTYIERG